MSGVRVAVMLRRCIPAAPLRVLRVSFVNFVYLPRQYLRPSHNPHRLTPTRLLPQPHLMLPPKPIPQRQLTMMPRMFCTLRRPQPRQRKRIPLHQPQRRHITLRHLLKQPFPNRPILPPRIHLPINLLPHLPRQPHNPTRRFPHPPTISETDTLCKPIVSSSEL